MPAEAEGSLPTTASGTALRGSQAVTTLRWVYPARGLVTVLADSLVVLGRAPTSTTQLDTERVSRKHAELKPDSNGHVVRDLDSKNGTFVNGEKIEETSLRPGDVLRLGDCVAVVETVGLDDLAGFRDLGHGILGGSAMAPVVERVRRAATSGSDLFLLGETGTGKELLARAYHRYGSREGAFVVFDCTSGAESTRSGDLFGRSERALPPGEHPSVGHVRAADRGTLLLDGLLDLSVDLQTKLAKTMEKHEVTPLGEARPIAVDVRFVATSSVASEERPPERYNALLKKHFGGLTVRVPPLRQRRADIVPLFLNLLERHGRGAPPKLEPELVEQLCLHDWPMNIRELDSVARRLVERADEGELRLEHFADAVSLRAVRTGRAAPTPPPASRRAGTPYPSAELAALRAALERHGGNLTKAANELEITRSKAYRMLKLAEDD